MAIDVSIYQNMLRAPKTVAEYDAEAQAAQQNKLTLQMGRMKADEYTRGIADQTKLRQVVSGFGADKTANYNALLGAGRLTDAQKYAKENAEIEKETAALGKTKAETGKISQETVMHQFEIAGQLAGAWANSPSVTKAQIASGLQAALASGVISEQIAQSKVAELSQLPENPAALNQWAQGTLQQVMKAKDSMSFITPDANTVANNTQSNVNSQRTAASSRYSADSSAASSRYSANTAAGTAAANRAQVQRHFDVTNGAGGKMTEDQSKATGWLVQAENAWSNLRKAAFDKSGKLTAAAKPGIGDGIASIPLLGGVGNSMRSAERQKFVQAASSMSEAFLRAATGAGVNYEEAKQKVEELTPVWGEAQSVTEQKFAAIPLYIDSLKVRAGPGAKKAADVLGNAQPGANGVPSDIAALLSKHGGKK